SRCRSRSDRFRSRSPHELPTKLPRRSAPRPDPRRTRERIGRAPSRPRLRSARGTRNKRRDPLPCNSSARPAVRTKYRRAATARAHRNLRDRIEWTWALRLLLRHRALDFIRLLRQRAREADQFPVVSNNVLILNAHAERLLGQINARLDREDGAGLQRCAGRARVVNRETDVVAEAVDEVLAERLAVDVFAVRVDVILRDAIERVLARLQR